MKRILSATCIAALCGSAALAAQATPTSHDQMDKKAAETTTVSGCVAAAPDGSRYMLTNALPSASAMAKDAAEDKAVVAKDAASHPMMYMLMGGENLKAHVGHKVEVTGSLAKGGMDHGMMAKEKMDESKMAGEKMAGDKMAHEKMTGMDKEKMSAMMGGMLTVTSLKMISATCP